MDPVPIKILPIRTPPSSPFRSAITIASLTNFNDEVDTYKSLHGWVSDPTSYIPLPFIASGIREPVKN